MSRFKRDNFKVTPLNTSITSKNIDTLSYNIDDGKYISGDIIIDNNGVKRTPSGHLQTDDENNNKNFYDEIEDNGIKLSDIEFLHFIGAGNCGAVYYARHNPTGRIFAMKEVNIMARQQRHQILKELRIIYQTQCSSLVKCYGAFYRDSAIYIALEYLDAGSLENIMKQVKIMPENIIANLAHQLVEGLNYLHLHHQIHRDVKPSNICLNFKGEAKFLDFGISRELENSFAYCDSFVGTCNHMSPERIQGKSYSYSSDIWSLGIILLQCALGKYPYELNEELYMELMHSIVSGPPDIPNTLSPTCRSFIKACVRINPDQRTSAANLLKHPFISHLNEREIVINEMSLWLKDNVKAVDINEL